jgi:transcription antitermination factor NusG
VVRNPDPLEPRNVAGIVLRGKGYYPYLPLYRASRRRLERIIETDYPLFPDYVFCRFDAKKRLPILMTTGVVSIVGFGNEPAAIPDHEIEAVRTVLLSGLHAEPCPYLQEGQPVRITHGSLGGVEGTLLKKKNHVRMVISVAILQRSISVETDRDRLLAI